LDINEQKAIAEVLSSIDDKIELLQRQNETLEEMAMTLFRQWFIEPTKDGLPEGWEEVELSKLGQIVCGKTPSKNKPEYFGGKIPFIKIPDMHGNVFVFKTEDSLSEIGAKTQKNKTLPERSICVSCIATVGLVSMNAFISQTNQQINSIIPYKEFYRYFLYLKMKSMKEELIAMASGGTATLNLNTTEFSKIKIEIQKENYLQAFHEKVKYIFEKIFINTSQIQTLEKLRDILLPKLMSGGVRVKF
jgi:type I restriction enzyme S subunit